MKLIYISALLFLALAWAPMLADAMKITSAAPGNVFVAGKPMQFAVSNVSGSLHYELTDYFGYRAAKGEAAVESGDSTISIAGRAPGWYRLKCRDDKGSVETSVGVVIDRGEAALPADGRVCVDAATAGLIYNEAYRVPIAKMVRLAGIPWVRERFVWSGIEREPGKYDWGINDCVVNSFADEGVRVCQVWIFSPAWAHPVNPNTQCPDDLRAVYNFTKAAAQRYTGKVQAWEVWNEPEIDFWLDLSDTFAGLHKAAYLGFKNGSPNAAVLQSSFCLGVSPFSTGAYQSGLSGYYDIFNWHIYDKPSVLPSALAAYRDFLRKNRVVNRPAWLTEAGIRIKGSGGERKSILARADLDRQCRFVPQSIVMSLVAGNEKHFFFVLPDLLENTIQYGVLNPDLTPNPAFIALSAAANILGLSDYLGEYKPEGSDAIAQVFGTPLGTVLAAWADRETVLDVPTDKTSVRIADMFGQERKIEPAGGSVRVTVGPEAVYLIDIGNSIASRLTGRPILRAKMPSNRPSRIVIVGRCGLPIHKGQNSYMLGNSSIDARSQTVDFQVEIYNFDEKKPASGTVQVSVPAKWKVEKSELPVTLGPMDRKVLLFRLTPDLSSRETMSVTVRAKFGKERVAPSVSYFRVSPAAQVPVKRQPLDWEKAELWKMDPAGNASITLSNPDPETLRFAATVKTQGDPWAFPEMRFEKPADLSAFDGIAFNLKCDLDDANSWVRLNLIKPNGAQYMNGTRVYGDKRRIVFLFKEMWQTSFIAPDPENSLDLSRIVGIKLGCSTTKERMTFEIENMELVKF